MPNTHCKQCGAQYPRDVLEALTQKNAEPIDLGNRPSSLAGVIPQGTPLERFAAIDAAQAELNTQAAALAKLRGEVMAEYVRLDHHGSPKAAAAALGISEQSVHKALRRAKDNG